MAYRRVVAKFGTNLLTAGTDRLDLGVMASLVGQVAALTKEGVEVLIVTSGAITAGRHALGAGARRRDMPFRQVLASVGQSHLMRAYDELFQWHDLTAAQCLLTRRDLSDRAGYLNARNTLLALLEMRVIPIVNENDVVAIDEIEGATIGDNDNLSALVANLVDADLLAILSDTPGLYTADPRKSAAARLVEVVETIDGTTEAMAGGAGSGRARGGMITKLQAAKLATAGGADTVIASGHERDALIRIARGERVGTLFPAKRRLDSRERWMLAGLSARGRIVVDDGAAKALRERHKSLLPAGVREVSGAFQRGDAVDILDGAGARIACGISNYDAADVKKIAGAQTGKIAAILGAEYAAEVVHRNNLVVL